LIFEERSSLRVSPTQKRWIFICVPTSPFRPDSFSTNDLLLLRMLPARHHWRLLSMDLTSQMGARKTHWFLRSCLLTLGLSVVSSPWYSQACTTAVISGKATADGRPILWKNRDTSEARNEVAYLTDGKYAAIAVVNAGSRKSVWMGSNETGFCIENSLSKDLALPEKQSGPGNGSLMKRALQTCRTVDDFEELLKATNQSGRSTIANYGVIDASGGAAMFETGPTSYKKFDANDEADAPKGYIVRSNFATTAQDLPATPSPEEVLQANLYSGIRYARACSLLDQRAGESIDVAFLVRQMSRDLADESGEPFPGSVSSSGGTLPERIMTETTISRSSTVSAAVFHGVRTDESPKSTTMWVLLGDPKFTIAVPCWVTGKPVADPLEDKRGGELGEIARTLRDWSLTVEADAMLTEGLPGIWKDVWKTEDTFLQKVVDARERWSRTGFDSDEAYKLHNESAADAMVAMQLEMSEAKQEALYEAVDGDYSNEILAKQEKIKVAIYDHSDGSSAGPINLKRILSDSAGFDCTTLHPDEIRFPKLAEFDLLIVPGGSGSLQSKNLGDEGRDTIRKFVSDGGGYIGICAGSYLASAQYPWSLSLINARVWDRAHWARGTGTVSIEFTPDGSDAMKPPAENIPVYYGQGPLLLPSDRSDLPPYEVLASYRTEIAAKGAPVGAMVDTHAIIRSTFGEGRVVCLSPHPEKTGGPDWIISSLTRWVAKNRADQPDVTTIVSETSGDDQSVAAPDLSR